MADPTPSDRRESPDRRRRPTRPWDVLFTPARRRWNRRAGDVTRHIVVDRHGPALFFFAVALLLLTLADGLLTLLLIRSHHDELNPVMARLLQLGSLWFMLGKYAMTAAALPLLIIWKNHRMFGTRFRVKYLVPVFVGMYLVLTTCQVWAVQDPHGLARALHTVSTAAHRVTGGSPQP